MTKLRQKLKRIAAMLMAVMLVGMMLPVSAFADDPPASAQAVLIIHNNPEYGDIVPGTGMLPPEQSSTDPTRFMVYILHEGDDYSFKPSPKSGYIVYEVLRDGNEFEPDNDGYYKLDDPEGEIDIAIRYERDTQDVTFNYDSSKVEVVVPPEIGTMSDKVVNISTGTGLMFGVSPKSDSVSINTVKTEVCTKHLDDPAEDPENYEELSTYFSTIHNSYMTSRVWNKAKVTITTSDIVIPLEGISITQGTIEEHAIGDTFSIPVTFTPANASNKELYYESTDENVATVDADGTVTAVGNGSCRINVTSDDGGHTAHYRVVVASPFTISYNGNGGTLIDTGTPVSYDYTGHANAFAKACMFSKENCVFTRWNTNADGTGRTYGVGAQLNADTTLYAQWVQNIDPPVPNAVLKVGSELVSGSKPPVGYKHEEGGSYTNASESTADVPNSQWPACFDVPLDADKPLYLKFSTRQETTGADPEGRSLSLTIKKKNGSTQTVSVPDGIISFTASEAASLMWLKADYPAFKRPGVYINRAPAGSGNYTAATVAYNTSTAGSYTDIRNTDYKIYQEAGKPAYLKVSAGEGEEVAEVYAVDESGSESELTKSSSGVYTLRARNYGTIDRISVITHRTVQMTPALNGAKSFTYSVTDASGTVRGKTWTSGTGAIPVKVDSSDPRAVATTGIRVTAVTPSAGHVAEGTVITSAGSTYAMNSLISCGTNGTAFTVECPEESAEAEVMTRVNGSAPASDTAAITLAGVTESGGRYYASSTAVTATVTPATGMTLKGVIYKAGTAEPVAITKNAQGKYVVPESVVETAAKAKQAITIEATVEAITHKITFVNTDRETISIKEYTPAVRGVHDTILMPEKIGNEITGDRTVPDSSTFCFIAETTDEDYKINSVMENGSDLPVGVDMFGLETSHPYYTLRNIKADTTVTVTDRSVKPIPEDKTFRAVIDNTPYRPGVIGLGVSGAERDAEKSTSAATVYKITDGATAVKFTANCSALKEPAMYLADVDSKGDIIDSTKKKLTPVKTELSKDYRTRLTEYSIPAADLADKAVYLTGQDTAEKKVTISCEPDAVKSYEVGTKTMTPDSSGKVTCAIRQYSTATITPSMNSLYTLSGNALVNDKTVALVEDSLSFVVTDDTEVVFSGYKGDTPTPVPPVGEKTLMMTYNGEDIPLKDGDVVHTGSEDRCSVFVASGSAYDPIEEFTLKSGKKDVTEYGIAKLNAAHNAIRFNAETATEEGIATAVLSFTTESGDSYALTFEVAKPVTSVRLSGFDKKGTAEQMTGTTAVYTVTLDKGADYSSVKPVVTGDAGVTSAYDPEEHTLTVNTFKGARLAEPGRDISIQFKHGSVEVGDTFLIEVTEPALKMPAATLKQATDIGMVFTTDLPESLKDTKNLYYMAEAEAIGNGVADGMLDYAKAYANAGSGTLNITLADSKHRTPGMGAAQAYDVTITLIQLKDDALGFTDGNELSSSASRVFKNVKTKKPAYPASFSLTKKNATIYTGQSNVVIAEAKFDAKATFTNLTDARLTVTEAGGITRTYTLRDPALSDNENRTAGRILALTPDGLGIMVTDTYDMATGSGKLYAEAESGSSSLPMSAETAVTVKPGIEYIYVSVPATKLYKADNKAASITASAKVGSYSGSKPASTKVKWSVCSTSDDREITKTSGHELSGYISIKNGKVTVAKGYEATGRESFYVVARAADYKNSDVYGRSSDIAITDTSYKLGSIEVVDGIGSRASEYDLRDKYYSSELIGCYIAVYDKSGDILPTSDYAISAPSSIALYDYDDAYMIGDITKAGTITVTAKSLDGKSTKRASLKIKAGTADGYDLTGYTEDGNDVEFTRGKGYNRSNAYVRLRTYVISDSVCTNKSSIKVVKGGVLIKSNNKTDVIVCPTANRTEIDVKYGKETDSYVMYNEAYSAEGYADFHTRDTTFYPGYTKTFLYEVEADDLTGGPYFVKLLPVDAGSKNKAYYSMMESLSQQNIALAKVKAGVFTASITLDGGATKGLAVDRYKAKAVICSYAENGVVYETAPATITLNAKKAPAAPKATLKTSYTIAPKADGNKVTGQARLEFSKITPSGSEVAVTGLYANTVKGETNDFLKYFELTEIKGEPYISVRSDIAYDEKSMLLRGDVYSSDMKGWVAYTCTNSAEMTTQNKVLITIKIK